MRYFLYIVSALVFLIAFSSCSSEETPEERILGTWTGSILEPEFGFFQADITLTKVSSTETIAQISYGANDKSLCNNDIFFCDDPSEACAPTWMYNGFANETYTFLETPIGTFCAPGLVTLRFQSDDVLSYDFVGTEEPDITSSGTLNRL